MPPERKVYYPHRGDWWRGLPRCGTDPVRSTRAGAHSSSIHSFWSQPGLPDRSRARLFQPQGGGARW
ncbi:tumor necrosis factor receptor superfamily, member 12a, isoform CRA_a [Mus musculus]|nr:tumor necrosis factor receptor superfamily, member 12a, isoform CRA_a [Mus musculus]